MTSIQSQSLHGSLERNTGPRFQVCLVGNFQKDQQITQLSNVIVMASDHVVGHIFLKQLYFLVSLSSFNLFPRASSSLSMTSLAILKQYSHNSVIQYITFLQLL